MKRILVPIAALWLQPQLALAEVCDKIAGESWIPADGPFNVLTWPGFSKLLVIAVAGFLLCRAFHARNLARSRACLRQKVP